MQLPTQPAGLGPVQTLAWYLLAMNALGFGLMALDKHRAKCHGWRIPEAGLFFAALAGGSAGCWAGMLCFRHKTRHWYFVVGMPTILALQLAALVFAAVQAWRG